MAQSAFGLPERKRNYRFALTPLADAMFQLLIFFMLSSGLTPYSLLPLQDGAAPAGEDAVVEETSDETEAQEAPEAAQTDVTLWTVEPDVVIVGGQPFEHDALDDLAEGLKAGGAVPKVILLVRPTARVQDISTVLSRLNAAKITAVQISTAPGG